jgi:hypothetical protein
MGFEVRGSKIGSYTARNDSTFDALYLARGFIEVLADSVPKFLSFPMEDQLVFYLVANSWPTEKFVKYAKYVTAYPMAKFLNNPLPSKPEGFTGNPLFSGKVKRLLKARLVSKCDRNARLFFGILQGVKRAAAPVTEDFVQKSFESHREALSTPPRGIAPDGDHQYRYMKVFETFKYPKKKLFEATKAASFQTKRSTGGAREWIRERLPEGLISMVEVRPGVVKEIRGKEAPSFDEVVRLASEGSRKVMVSAVLEPLKVRLITKGDSYRYWCSRFYQKALWRHLQTFPQFALTGRPLEQLDLLDLLDREAKLGLNFPDWVSGDYSSATDSLDIRHTKAAFEASLFKDKSGGLLLQDVLRSVLYEQEIHYPSKSGLSPINQTTGQLMGSTLSFPILCVVNLTAYWRALETFLGRTVEVFDLPVLVNGDDILFRANQQLYDLWQKEIHDVGFELSLGKNYIHSTYLTVNSQLYSFRSGEFSHLGFLNAGLLTGQSKITGRTGARLAPLWDYYNEVVHSSVCPERTHRRFMHYHRKTIEELTTARVKTGRNLRLKKYLKGQDGTIKQGGVVKTTFNVFLPFERGGLGFIPIPGMEIKVTSFQERYASYLNELYLADPSKATKIALVTERSQHKLRAYHEPRWIIGPKIGPQLEFVVEPEDREFFTPILVDDIDYLERPEMKVRLPYQHLEAFRKTTVPKMRRENLLSFPWKLLELKVDEKSDDRKQSHIVELSDLVREIPSTQEDESFEFLVKENAIFKSHFQPSTTGVLTPSSELFL